MGQGKWSPHRLRQWGCILMAGVMMITAISGSMVATAGRWLVGDVNLSGKVELTDARLILQAAVGKIQATDIPDLSESLFSLVADVNNDQKVNTTDARLVLQYVVGKISSFAAGEYVEDTPEPEVPDVIAANRSIEAVWFDASSTASNAAPNNLAADFTSLGGGFSAGDRLIYKNVDFADGDAKAVMMLISASRDQSDRHVDIYVDQVDEDHLIATVNPPSNPKDEYSFYECYAALKQVTGKHDVILSFREDMDINIDWFTFSAYDGNETAEQKDARMAWFRDARFGMFIHFGPYSLPGGVYNGRNVGGNGAEWIMNLLNISREAYARDIAKPFNPTEFDANEIVALAKQAGQKYITITSKHHDGFSMFDTRVRTFRDYSLMGFGDYKGPDPLMELSKACRENDIQFCVYYSIPDWYDSSQSNWGNTMDMNKKEEYKTRMKAQLRELVEQYDPAIIWFDQGGDRSWWNDQDGEEFYRYLRTMKPSIIVNNRIFSESKKDSGDFGTPEQVVPGSTQTFDWESCMTINGSWGYKSYDQNWKSAKSIVSTIVDVASKGGNLLLNIGPDGLGRVPEGSRNVLEQVGEWMAKYGDSIYGTRQSGLTLRDGCKATKKEGRLYLFLESLPSSGSLTIPSLENEILDIRNMATGASLSYQLRPSELVIDLTGVTADPYMTVVEVRVSGVPTGKVYTNYALQASKVEVSNYYQNNSQYNGEKAIDGNPATRWATDDHIRQATLTLTFDEPITVDTVCLIQHTRPESQTNWTNAFQIEYWEDGRWKVCYQGGDPGLTYWCEFEAVTSTRFRLNITDAFRPTFWEFQLYLLRATA